MDRSDPPDGDVGAPVSSGAAAAPTAASGLIIRPYAPDMAADALDLLEDFAAQPENSAVQFNRDKAVRFLDGLAQDPQRGGVAAYDGPRMIAGISGRIAPHIWSDQYAAQADFSMRAKDIGGAKSCSLC